MFFGQTTGDASGACCRFSSVFSHTPPQLGRCLMTMSNTMICGATKIWYYIPERKSAAFETWLEATRPDYIESLEAGPERCLAIMVLLSGCSRVAVKLNTPAAIAATFSVHMCIAVVSFCTCYGWFVP